MTPPSAAYSIWLDWMKSAKKLGTIFREAQCALGLPFYEYTPLSMPQVRALDLVITVLTSVYW